MMPIRTLTLVALAAVLATACVPQTVPTPPQPAATTAPIERELAVHALPDLPEEPAAVSVTVDSSGVLAITRPDGGTRALGQGGATLLTADSAHVVWAEACSACEPSVAAEQRGLHVYAVGADNDQRLLADRLPRFNEVLLGDGWLAVLLPSAGHANAAELRVFDLATGESRSLSDRALAISGAMRPLLAVQDERVAWVDALNTTSDLALRVAALDTGEDVSGPTPVAEPQALVVSRGLVAWRDAEAWRGLDLSTGAAWTAPLAPADVSLDSIRAIGAPRLIDRQLVWTLDTVDGTSAVAVDVP